ncbi:MAG: hypothetical protein QOC71_364 [Thermoplasmata archaeon]|nr:hypothetical protein [Thermoplasmata archaeon]
MKPPTMRTPALATVYLDNERVGLMGDPMPRVSKIVAASGKRPEGVQVLRALSASDLRGKPVRLEDTIDRTAEPTKPIYLTCAPVPRASALAFAAAPPMGTPPRTVHEPDDQDEPKVPAPEQRRTPPPFEPEPEWDP